ncbi:MAG TPA: Trp family transcriptional regulator [Candidatus Paceibacterota bacterium]|nr:Trp family transcriptional regulator [Candidatus Paceibacterota bacterium]
MGKINEFKAGEEWEKKIWHKFLENVENSKGDRKISWFLDNILTENEKKFISKRLAALSLIESGKSYKEIGRILWISPCTISAIKKVAKRTSGYFSNREYRIKNKNKKNINSIKSPPYTILNYWADLPLPSKSKRQRRHS